MRSWGQRGGIRAPARALTPCPMEALRVPTSQAPQLKWGVGQLCGPEHLPHARGGTACSRVNPSVPPSSLVEEVGLCPQFTDGGTNSCR